MGWVIKLPGVGESGHLVYYKSRELRELGFRNPIVVLV
jgi:hypothetical protein